MSKRKRAKHEDAEVVQPEAPATVDTDEEWDTAEFRRSVLIDLAFVTLPALIMVLLGQYKIAAAWFGVGVMAIVWQFNKQIRGFWRSLRSDGAAGPEEHQEP